jgi:predicted nucleotidyltransferase
MRTYSPPLLPIFRSAGQARILERIFLGGSERSLAALARETELAASRVHDEVSRLEDAGLLVSRRVGNSRFVSANRSSPYFPEVESLLMKAFGPVPVLEDRLSGVTGIEEAYVFGSWATRYLGEPGPPPADVDVLVIGTPDIEAVRAACREAAEPLGRDVDPIVLTRREWENGGSGFVATVRERPLVPLRRG